MMGKVLLKELRHQVPLLQYEKSQILDKRERELTEKGIDGDNENAIILEMERSMPKVEDVNNDYYAKRIDSLMDPTDLSDRELFALIAYKYGRQAECGQGYSKKESPKPKEKGIKEKRKDEENTSTKGTGQTKPTRRTKKLHKKPP